MGTRLAGSRWGSRGGAAGTVLSLPLGASGRTAARLSAVVVAAVVLAVGCPGVAFAQPSPTAPAPTPAAPAGAPSPGTPGGGTPPGPPASADEVGTALASAASSGLPVEVVGRRTPTEQLFANPDGTLRSVLSLRAERVRRPDGSWVPADTTLRRAPDGTVTPAASPAQVSFSGGGSSALATLSKLGKSISVSWPSALPAPAVSGDTATYADVLPGVDLRVTADVDGFGEQLVVKDAAAAANPALRSITFGVAATGVSVQVDGTGALAAVDSAGGTVFQAPPPMMWDSPTTADAAAAGLTGPHRAPVGVRVTSSGVELAPDPAMLAAPDLTFPLVIDPSWTVKSPAWTEVNAYDPNSSTWRTVPTSLAVGYQDLQAPSSLVRSFLRFPLSSAIFGTHVLSATLGTFETWSSSCTATGVEVWRTGGFSSSTTWNNQPAWTARQSIVTTAHGHDAGCPAAGVEFDVTGAAAAAARAHSSVTLGMKASNESDHLGWKKFQIDSSSPQLTVVYNHPPKTPVAADMSTSNPTTACSGTPHANAKDGVLLKVRASDPDRDAVRVRFQFWQSGGAAPIGSTTSAWLNAPAPPASNVVTASWQVPGGWVAEGVSYSWHAYVEDRNATTGLVMDLSGWSPWCSFVEDSVAPSQPTVTSSDYPTDGYGGLTGRPGSFLISPGVSTDTSLIGYHYGLDQPQPTTFVAASGTGKTATVSVTPPT